MYCSKCGKENSDAGKFCVYCGAPISIGAYAKKEVEQSKALKQSAALAKKGKKRGKIVTAIVLLIVVILGGVIGVTHFASKPFVGTMTVGYKRFNDWSVSSDGERVTFRYYVMSINGGIQEMLVEGDIQSKERSEDGKDIIYHIGNITENITENAIMMGNNDMNVEELLVRIPKRVKKDNASGTWSAMYMYTDNNDNNAEYMCPVRTIEFLQDGTVRVQDQITRGFSNKEAAYEAFRAELDDDTIISGEWIEESENTDSLKYKVETEDSSELFVEIEFEK